MYRTEWVERHPAPPKRINRLQSSSHAASTISAAVTGAWVSGHAATGKDVVAHAAGNPKTNRFDLDQTIIFSDLNVALNVWRLV